jgi:hypothetical protein
MYRFLDLSILSTEVYPEVIQRVKGGEKLLDLGCCFGQEVRQLVSSVWAPVKLNSYQSVRSPTVCLLKTVTVQT